MNAQRCAHGAPGATRQGGEKKAARRPPFIHTCFVELDGRPSGHEAPHDRDHREHEQNVNETAAHVEDHEAEQPALTLPLGDIQSDGGQTLLYEVLLPPRRPGQYKLARISLIYEAAGHTESETALDLAAAFTPGGQPGPGNPRVMNIVEKATTFKLQTRALEASMLGDVTNATRNLRAAATRLLNMGETELAEATEQEAQALESAGRMTPAGTKKLAFDTRKLA